MAQRRGCKGRGMTRITGILADGPAPLRTIPHEPPSAARRLLGVAAAITVLASGLSLATSPTASAVASCPTLSGSIPYTVTPSPSPGAPAGDWSGCDLAGANLNSAFLASANLSGANLTGANLNSAFLASANLSGANLTGANLNAAFMGSADLTGAFVTCGTGGILGTSIVFPPTAGTLPTGWTLISGTMTASIIACPVVAPAAPAAPPAPPLPAPESLPPVAGVAPAAEVPAGGSTGSVNGLPVATTVTVNPAGGVQVAGGGSTVALADLSPDGTAMPSSGGGLAGTPGGGLSVSASGLLAKSQADVYMYSEQLWLGKAIVDASGNVTMSLTIPSWVTPGGHTLQFVGYQGPYTSITLSTGISVAAPALISRPTASGEHTGYFLGRAVALSRAAKVGLWNAVNVPAQGRADALVSCTATYAEPVTAPERALWVQREAGITGFLTRAGCDTVIARLGDLTGVTGSANLAIRVTATTA